MAGNVIERTGTVPPSSRNRADSNSARYSRASTPYNAKEKTIASAYWPSHTDDKAPGTTRSGTPALRFDFQGNVIPRSANATPAKRVRAGSNARAPTPQWAIDHYAITAKKGNSVESDSWDMHGHYLGNISGGTTRRPRRGTYSRRSSSNSSRRSSKGDATTSMFDTALAYSNTYSRPGTRVKFDTPRPPSAAARDYEDTARYTTPFKVASARSHSPAYDIWGNQILQATEEDQIVEKRERIISRPASPLIAAPKPRRPFKVFEAEEDPVEEDTSAKILSAVAAHSMNISPEYDIMGNLLVREQERRISPLISRPAYTAPTPPPALSADDKYAVVVQTMPDLLRSRRYYDSKDAPAKPVRSDSSSASSASSSSSAEQARAVRPTPAAVSNTAKPRQRPRRRPRRNYYDQDDQKCAMM